MQDNTNGRITTVINCNPQIEGDHFTCILQGPLVVISVSKQMWHILREYSIWKEHFLILTVMLLVKSSSRSQFINAFIGLLDKVKQGGSSFIREQEVFLK